MKIKYPLLSNKKFSFSLCAIVSDFIEHWLLCMFSWTSSWRDKTLVSFTGLFLCWTPQLGISILQQEIHNHWLSLYITPPSPALSTCEKNYSSWYGFFELVFWFFGFCCKTDQEASRYEEMWKEFHFNKVKF